MKDSIFKFKEILSPDHLPDNLPQREEEIKKISSLINQTLKGRTRNVCIYGPPSTGKTASIKLIFKKLEKTKALPIYINCFKTNTNMAAIYSIILEFFQKVRPTRRMISRRGMAYDELLDMFVSEIGKNSVVPVVCFDEVDQLIHKGSKILYDLSRLKEESIPAQIIAISNEPDIFSRIDERIRSSLHPMEDIPYNAYGFEQIRKIIKTRAEMAFHSGVISKSAIDFLTGLTMEGDFRIARECLLQAGELAARKKRSKITEDHIKEVIDNSKLARYHHVLKELSEHEKFILRLIPEKGVELPQFFDFYQEQYSDSVKDRMFRNYLEKLAKLDMIKMERKGIGGAYFITLNIPGKALFENG